MNLPDAHARFRPWIAAAAKLARAEPSASFLGRLIAANLRLTGEARDGLPVAEWRFHSAMGRPKGSGVFSRGKPSGWFVELDWRGRRRVTAHYHDGELVHFERLDARGRATVDAWFRVDGSGESQWCVRDRDGYCIEAASGVYARGVRVRALDPTHLLHLRLRPPEHVLAARRLVDVASRRAAEMHAIGALPVNAGGARDLILAAWLCVDADEDVRTSARPVARHLVELLDSARISAWSHALRGPPLLTALPPDELRSLLREIARTPGSRSVLGEPIAAIASFHASGFVREAAVDALRACRGGDEVRFLLARTSDWVSEVALAAQLAIEERLVPGYAAVFARELGLVVMLENRARTHGRPFLAGIRALLASQAGISALLAAFDDPSRAVRRAAFHTASENSSVRRSVLERALATRDSSLRYWAARVLCAELDRDELVAFVARLAQDSFMPLRRVALRASWQRSPPSARLPIEPALVDRHASMRELARWLATQADPRFDALAFYRAAAARASGRARRAAVAGFAEVATRAELAELEALLDDPDPRCADVALESLGRIGGAPYAERLIAALAHSSPQRSRAARLGLRRGRVDVPVDALRAVLRSTPWMHAIRNALGVSARIGKWDELLVLLDASARDDAPPGVVRARLTRWFARHMHGLTGAGRGEIEALRAAFATARDHLAPEVRAQFEEGFRRAAETASRT